MNTDDLCTAVRNQEIRRHTFKSRAPAVSALSGSAIAIIALAWSASVYASDLSYVQSELSTVIPSTTGTFGAFTAASAFEGGTSLQGTNGGLSQSSTSISENSPFGGSAQGAASLRTGSLQAIAQENGITGASGAAGAAYWDTLFFSGAIGSSSTGTLTLTVPGIFTDVGNGGACLSVIPSVVGASCDPFSTTPLNSTNPSETLTASFSIINGNPVNFYAALFATASNSFNGATADLYDPPKLSLQLPTGVTYTSASGVFLAPVPLPAAFWLFGSGLLGLAGIARRHS